MISIIGGLRKDVVAPWRHDVRVVWTGKEIFERLRKIVIWEHLLKVNMKTYIKPNIVSFFRRSSDLHLTLRGRNDDAVLIETRWHGVGIKHRAHSFDVG